MGDKNVKNYRQSEKNKTLSLAQECSNDSENKQLHFFEQHSHNFINEILAGQRLGLIPETEMLVTILN